MRPLLATHILAVPQGLEIYASRVLTNPDSDVLFAPLRWRSHALQASQDVRFDPRTLEEISSEC